MKITSSQLLQVFDHVDEHRHSEVCGFIVLDADGYVEQIKRADNIAEHPGGLYLMDPISLAEAASAYVDGHQIVVYHSHPHMGPVPSMIDTMDAIEHPYDWRYLIVGDREFAMWSFGPGDRYEQSDIEILEDEPAPAA